MGQCSVKLSTVRAPATKRPPGKFLLLGVSGAGKSTICKIFELEKELALRNEPEKQALLTRFREPIVRNIINLLLECFKHSEPKSIPSDLWNLHSELESLAIEPMSKIDELRNIIRSLWSTEIIREIARDLCLQNDTASTNIGDSAAQFIERSEEIFASAFVPSFEDALAVRQITYTGNTVYYKRDNLEFMLTDISGEDLERPFWGSHYHDLSAVIYTVAASDYNVMAAPSKPGSVAESKLMKSIEVWENEVCKNEALRYKPKLVLLNKTDILKEKLSHEPFEQYFPSYTGPPNDASCILKFIGNLFREPFHKFFEGEDLIVYETCALDTNLVRNVMSIISKKIVELNISRNYVPLASHPIDLRQTAVNPGEPGYTYENAEITHLVTA